MMMETKRYTIEKVSEEDGFEDDIEYVINLKDGYHFGEDGSGLQFASDIDMLRELIKDIKKGDVK